MEISEINVKMEKYKKTKGISYINRSYECLQVRLKMPQWTCSTLQPLFDAYPEIEIIIVEKAKKTFYQKIIELENFLLDCDRSLVQKSRRLTVTQEYFYL